MSLFRLLCLMLLAGPQWLAAQNRPAIDESSAELRSEAVRAAEVGGRPELRERSRERSSVNVQGLEGRLGEWRLTDLKGRDATAQLAPQVEGDRMTVDSGSLRQFVIKPQAVETRIMDRAEVTELPGGIVVADEGAADAESESLSWFRLTFLASPLPAIWDPQIELYTTRVTFGLKRPAGISAAQTLEEPVAVRVSFDGLVGDEPPLIRIGGLGLENEQSFALRFRPTTETPRLRVRSTISDVDLVLRAAPRLAMQVMQSEILGFGLEEATFNVSQVQPHGAQDSIEERLPLAVSVEGRGEVKPPQPAFEPGFAIAQFSVRSSGLGPLPVRVQAGGTMAVATVHQAFPYGPLVAVLVGGALGGYARRFIKGARRTRVPRWIVEGLVVGLIAFVAGVFGVGYLNLPPAAVATEAGAFLVGAISGFIGVVVLEKLSGAMSRASA